MKRIALMAAILVGLAGTGFSAPADDAKILVTDVSIQEGMASVTLNDAIQIREIKVMKSGNQTSLRFPEYVSRSGRAYPQVTVHSKEAYDNILQAVKTGKTSGEKSKSIKFTISEPQILRSPTRRANVEVTFNDAVSVTVGVLKSKRQSGDPYWVGYPGRRPEGGGKYINQVEVTNPKLKKAVESAVVEKFQRAQSEKGEVEEPSQGGGPDEE
jgi:DNA-binding cell septation regulator SpoVG